MMPASRHLAGGDEMTLAVVEVGGRFEAALPFRRRRRWRQLLRPAAHARGLPVATSLTNPLVSPDGGAAALETLLAALRDEPGGPAVLVLEGFGEGGQVARHLRDSASWLALPLSVYESWERPVLNRQAAEQYWTAALSKERRRQLNRRRRRLAEALGGEVEVVNRSGDPAAAETFLAIEASGWKADAGGALLCRADTAGWFRELCRRGAQDDTFHLLSLEVDGQVAAMQCLLVRGDAAFLFRVGYDQRFAGYAPGVLVHVAAMEYFDAHTAATSLDSCATPNNRFVADLLPDRRSMSTIIVGLGGAGDRALLRALPYTREVAAHGFALTERARDGRRSAGAAVRDRLRRARR